MRIVLLAVFCVFIGHCDIGAQLLSPGKLAQDHAELEGLSNCTQCHTLGEKVPDDKCLACHEDLAVRIEADKGFHATVEQTCVECHSDHKGRDFKLIRWQPEEFDHNLTGYELEDAHGELECKSCHTTESYLGLSQDCLSCHEDEHRGQLGTSCLDCHTLLDWTPEKFDHDQAEFTLQGKHIDVECAECHPDGTYKPLEFQNCVDCHTDQHKGQFTETCTTCHTVEGWIPSLFDHETAAFKLRGQHVDVECAECHPGGAYKPLEFQNCVDCHTDQHEPSLGLNCGKCHAVSGWQQASDGFDHQQTRFPLKGAHKQVECEQCHVLDQFKGIAFAECRDCHTDQHEGQFAEDCVSCHSETAWKPTSFEHERSRFKLRGQHIDVECIECHPQGNYKPLDTDCMACHTDPHQGQFAVIDPEWGQFTVDCSHCHTVDQWVMINFDHDHSVFKLNGAHTEVDCEKCHLLETADDGSNFRRFKPLPMNCQDCHL